MKCNQAKRCCKLRDDELNQLDDLDGDSVFSLTSHEVGRLGERLACIYLRERGYEIVECNYRCDEGEVDIVAFDADAEEVVLVEVKTRRKSAHESDAYPEEAVDERKRTRYRRIARCYVTEHFPVLSIRFDVIAITLYKDSMAELEHIYSAFDWTAE